MRNLSIFLATVAACGLMSGAATAAQTQPQTPPEGPVTELDEITVTGERLEEAAREFVEEVAAAPRGTNIARWDRSVCIGAVNVQAEIGQILVDHVSSIALAVGLDVGESGCTPDVVIMVDSNADDLATRLVADSPQAFRPDIGSSNRGWHALQVFQSSGAPVRWWHVTQTVVAETGQVAEDGAQVAVFGASRLRGNVQENMSRVVILLDTTQIGSVSFAALSDYVAMVALAQVDPDADLTRFDTVLNLFSGRPENVGQRMTQWDLDFLRGLYSANGDALDPDRQVREIARAVAGNIRDSQDSDYQNSDDI